MSVNSVNAQFVIHSLYDCDPLLHELVDTVSREEFINMGDPLSKRIHQWAAKVFAVSGNGVQADSFQKVKEFFHELQDEILVSAINSDEASLRLKEPMLSGDLSLLAVGARGEYRPLNLIGMPLTWEKDILETFQKAHSKYFEGREGILPFQMMSHSYAKAMISLVNRVSFEGDTEVSNSELTLEATQVLEEMNEVSSIVGPLTKTKTRVLATYVLLFSDTVRFAAHKEMLEATAISRAERLSLQAHIIEELQQAGHEIEQRAIQLELDQARLLDENLERTFAAYTEALEILQANVTREQAEGESIRNEQRQTEVELPPLLAEQGRLEDQIRAAEAERNNKIRECDNYRREAEKRKNDFWCSIL